MKTETKHTPGPWKIGSAVGGIGIGINSATKAGGES